MISLKTGTRPGALQHAKISNWNSRRRDDVTGHQVILVTHHKRQVDGPAPLSLHDELQSLMGIYVDKILP